MLLEKLQRRFARFVKGDYRTASSVSQMLHNLGWRDLKTAAGIFDFVLQVTGPWLGSCGQQDQSKSQIQIRENRIIFRFDWASCATHLLPEHCSDWNQLPAVVVEQETPAACFQSSVGQIGACRMPSHYTTAIA